MIELNKINNFGMNYIARIRKKIETKDKKIRKESVKMETRNIINFKMNILKIAMLLFMVFLAIPNISFAANIITAEPKNITVSENENATFSVSATGSNLSYLWLYKKPDGFAIYDWTEIPSTLASGMNTNTLTVKDASLLNNGYAFRCLVKSSAGDEISNIAYLYIENADSIQRKVTPNYRVYENEGTYYATLQDAYDSITGNSGTIIVDLDNEDTSPLTIASGKNITIDTNGKIVTKLSSQITNNGTLNIIGNGTIQTAETDKNVLYNLIYNNGTLNINDATLINNGTTGSGGHSVINNYSNLNVNSGTLKVQVTPGKTTAGYLRAISTRTGTTTINGGNIICDYNGSSENNYAILSYTSTNGTGDININGGIITSLDRGVGISVADGYNNTGKLTMNGGTIIAENYAIYHDTDCTGDFIIVGGIINSSTAIGIYNNSTGKLVIGSKGGNISINNPTIVGKTHAITSGSDFYFYDGILKGAIATHIGTIKEIEPGCMKYESTEVIEGTTYNTLMLLTDVKDITPPFGQINVVDSTYKDKVFYVDDKNITVEIIATDDSSKSEEIELYITFDEIDLTKKIPENSWESYYDGYTKALTLPDIMVTNRIYVLFKDGIGNISAAFTGTNVECTVNFNANGGTGSIASRKGVYGTACILPEENPVKSGKYFYGWNTDASSTVALYKPGGIMPASAFNDSTNITLYAIYGDNPLLADVVKVGDYIDFPVYYNDVVGNTTIKNNTWVVKNTNVDLNGNNSTGTVNIISKGIPLVANASATDNEIINDTLNMLTTGGSTKYIENGFVEGRTLKEIFTNKYVTLESGITPKVKAEVDGDNVYIIVSLKPTVRTTGKDNMNNWKLEQEIESSLVSFLPNGAGASVSPVSKQVYYNSAYGTLPTPTRAGYDFLGWYTTSGNIRKITNTSIVETIVGHSLEASWQARNDTVYKVEHWQQTVTGGATQNDTNYTLKETETFTGTTNISVTPEFKSYTGFTQPSAKQTVTILGDGTTVVKYYYTRNSYTLTLTAGSNVSSVSGGGTYRYGASANINATLESASGYSYSWTRWNSNNTSLHGNVSAQNTSITMPAGNLTLTATATRTANTYTVSLNANGGSVSPTSISVTYGGTYSGLPTPTRTNYNFLGWYTAQTVGTNITSDTVVTESANEQTLYAHWEVNNQAPTLTNVSISNKTTTGFRINALATDVNEDTLNYQFYVYKKGTSTLVGSSTSSNVAYGTTATYTISGLSNYTEYDYKVVVTDPSNETATKTGVAKTKCPGTGWCYRGYLCTQNEKWEDCDDCSPSSSCNEDHNFNSTLETCSNCGGRGWEITYYHGSYICYRTFDCEDCDYKWDDRDSGNYCDTCDGEGGWYTYTSRCSKCGVTGKHYTCSLHSGTFTDDPHSGCSHGYTSSHN